MIFKGIYKIFETIYDHAKKEYYDESKIQRRLLELNILYEDEEITEEEYKEMQDKLIERLLEIKEAKMLEQEEEEE